MPFDEIIQKIQQDTNSAPQKFESKAHQKKFLISWLKQIDRPTPVKTPEILALAREAALALAKDDNPSDPNLIQKAFNFLYINQPRDIFLQHPLTEKAFLAKSYVCIITQNHCLIKPVKNWSKIKIESIGNIQQTLIQLYEAAYQEINALTGSNAEKLEHLQSLEQSFDKPYLDAKKIYVDRLNRLAGFMFSTESKQFTATNDYWKKYGEIFGVIKQEASLETLSKNMVEFIPNKTETTKQIALSENNPSFEDIQQYSNALKVNKHNEELERVKNLWESLKSETNPREKFWKTLHPELTHVYLGDKDEDWPAYGEGVIVGRMIINYRKLALMAQHRDLHLLIIGAPIEEIIDPLTFPVFQALPQSRPLNDEELKFCSYDEAFWAKQATTLKYHDGFELLTGVMRTLNKYRAGRAGNEGNENEISPEAVREIMEEIKFMYESGFLSHIAVLKQKPENQLDENLKSGLGSILYFPEAMKSRDTSCFNKWYLALESAISSIGKDTLKSISFKRCSFVNWSGHIPAQLQKSYFIWDVEQSKQISEKMTDIDTLIKWVGYESQQGAPLPIALIVQRFRELSSGASMTKIYNFIYNNLQTNNVTLFSEQAGQIDGLSFTKHFFTRKLFPEGIDLSILINHQDYIFALELHRDCNIPGVEKTIDAAAQHLLKTDQSNSMGSRYAYVRLLTLVVSSETITYETFRKLIDIIKNRELANQPLAIIQMFDLEVIPKILPFIRIVDHFDFFDLSDIFNDGSLENGLSTQRAMLLLEHFLRLSFKKYQGLPPLYGFDIYPSEFRFAAVALYTKLNMEFYAKTKTFSQAYQDALKNLTDCAVTREQIDEYMESFIQMMNDPSMYPDLRSGFMALQNDPIAKFHFLLGLNVRFNFQDLPYFAFDREKIRQEILDNPDSRDHFFEGLQEVEILGFISRFGDLIKIEDRSKLFKVYIEKRFRYPENVEVDYRLETALIHFSHSIELSRPEQLLVSFLTDSSTALSDSQIAEILIGMTGDTISWIQVLMNRVVEYTFNEKTDPYEIYKMLPIERSSYFLRAVFKKSFNIPELFSETFDAETITTLQACLEHLFLSLKTTHARNAFEPLVKRILAHPLDIPVICNLFIDDELNFKFKDSTNLPLAFYRELAASFTEHISGDVDVPTLDRIMKHALYTPEERVSSWIECMTNNNEWFKPFHNGLVFMNFFPSQAELKSISASKLNHLIKVMPPILKKMALEQLDSYKQEEAFSRKCHFFSYRSHHDETSLRPSGEQSGSNAVLVLK